MANPSPKRASREATRGEENRETAMHDASLESAPDRPVTQDSRDLPETFGRYRIVRELGRGGMGAVYLAHDSQFDGSVALKIPQFSEGDEQDGLERFLREARALFGIRHPGICPIYDVGVIDGRHFISMGYIEGQTLQAFKKPLKPATAAHLVEQLAAILAYAHGKGIVHRDLKPSNVMIGRDRTPVVMDFGLARRETVNESRLTQTGTILGTPAYMSPEQVLGKPNQIGPATDIYSLGVILYELLTGTLPFNGPPAAVFAQILTKRPQPPSARNPKVDADVEAICAQAMAKDVNKRYTSMAALGGALRDYRSSIRTTDHRGPATDFGLRDTETYELDVPSHRSERRRSTHSAGQRPPGSTVAAFRSQAPSRVSHGGRRTSRGQLSARENPLSWATLPAIRIAAIAAGLVLLIVIVAWLRGTPDSAAGHATGVTPAYAPNIPASAETKERAFAAGYYFTSVFFAKSPGSTQNNSDLVPYRSIAAQLGLETDFLSRTTINTTEYPTELERVVLGTIGRTLGAEARNFAIIGSNVRSLEIGLLVEWAAQSPTTDQAAKNALPQLTAANTALAGKLLGNATAMLLPTDQLQQLMRIKEGVESRQAQGDFLRVLAELGSFKGQYLKP
jgi:serine/threonine protein kinase